MRKEVVAVILLGAFVLVVGSVGYFYFGDVMLGPKEETNSIYETELNQETFKNLILESGRNLNEGEKIKSNGYIVVLNTPSIIEEKIRIEKTGASLSLEKVNEQKSKIEREQFSLENNIRSLSSNIKVERKIQNVLNAFVVKEVTDAELNQIKNFQTVKRVYPNYEVEFNLMDSVPLINADDVWQMRDNLGRKITGRGVTIGIIDSGVDYTHPDLGNCTKEQFLSGNCQKVTGGYDFGNTIDMNSDGDLNDCYVEDISGLYCEQNFSLYTDKNEDGDDEDCYTESQSGEICEQDFDPMDGSYHGTHVASIAASNGALKGVAPGAKIIAYKISLTGADLAFIDSVLGALDISVDPNQDGNFSDHLDVVSGSIGVRCFLFPDFPENCGPNDILSTAVDNVVNAGVVAVFSAGNDQNEMTIASPGTARNAITVGGSFKNDSVEYYSSGPVFGEDFGIIKPDIVAPGKYICAARYDSTHSDSLCFDELHIALSGTSMAAPHVSGLVALIKQAHPDWSPREIKHALRNSAVDLQATMNRQGYGRVNALGAVSSNKLPIALINTGGVLIGTEEISGIATADNFSHYELEISSGFYESVIDSGFFEREFIYGALEGYDWEEIFEVAIELDAYFYPLNLTWTKISESNYQIINGTFVTLNSALLDDDVYYLKLKVYSLGGQVSEDRTILLVHNVLCGNNKIELGETCDDGNLNDGDGCSSVCKIEREENCSLPGDEDGNGLADCADSACPYETYCNAEQTMLCSQSGECVDACTGAGQIQTYWCDDYITCDMDSYPLGDAQCQRDGSNLCCSRTAPLTCSELGGNCISHDCGIYSLMQTGNECNDQGEPGEYCCSSYCGDGICDSATESSSNCPEDCQRNEIAPKKITGFQEVQKENVQTVSSDGEVMLNPVAKNYWASLWGWLKNLF